MSHRGPGLSLDLPLTKDRRPILSRADLDQYDHAPTRSGGRERYFCPIHGGDHQRSLSVDPATGNYTCHTCHASGTLHEHWPSTHGTPLGPARALSVEEMGRRALAAQSRADEERAARLAADLPPAATAFIDRLDAMSAALRAPACPGAAYLRGRGLDPAHAGALGVGYADANAWPSDRNQPYGRIVYPLADPATGRVVSASGRLSVDPSPAWSTEQRAAFKDAKQRKLTGCPASVWPYASIVAAREQGTPLVLVEGPADTLALAQGGTLPYPVLTLLGTANLLTRESLSGVAGVILAFDEDARGVEAARKAWIALSLLGVLVEEPARGWLGGAKDAGELAARCVAPGDEGADGALALASAIDALTRAGERLLGRADSAPAVGVALPAGFIDDDEEGWIIFAGAPVSDVEPQRPPFTCPQCGGHRKRIWTYDDGATWTDHCCVCAPLVIRDDNGSLWVDGVTTWPTPTLDALDVPQGPLGRAQGPGAADWSGTPA